MKNELVQGYREHFGATPAVVTRAPGRLEILGNHTDYNEGVVLSVAVDRETWVAAGPAKGGGQTCELRDLATGGVRTFKLDAIGQAVPRDWANYIKGLVVELQKRGHTVPAFNAVFKGTVPLSAGMSSSAAFEMSFALAIGQVAGLTLPWQEWARIGQGSENNYVGAKTGLLDQFSSLKGKAGHLVFSDFRSLEVQNIPLPSGVAMVVANCMVKHHLTNEYNDRRESCEAAVASLRLKLPQVKALRDVSMPMLQTAKGDLEILAFRRALHVVGENERVFAGIEALKHGDIAAFGGLMLQSHESSRVNFENSCDELDILVESGRALPGFIGARLSGGGFGGITVHFVAEAAATDYARRLATAFELRTQTKPEVMVCHAADGAQLVEL